MTTINQSITVMLRTTNLWFHLNGHIIAQIIQLTFLAPINPFEHHSNLSQLAYFSPSKLLGDPQIAYLSPIRFPQCCLFGAPISPSDTQIPYLSLIQYANCIKFIGYDYVFKITDFYNSICYPILLLFCNTM